MITSKEDLTDATLEEFKFVKLSKVNLLLSILLTVPTGAFKFPGGVLRYATVKVVFDGPTPNLSELIKFVGSKLLSVINSFPCKSKIVLFGSAMLSEDKSYSEPCPKIIRV